MFFEITPVQLFLLPDPSSDFRARVNVKLLHPYLKKVSTK